MDWKTAQHDGDNCASLGDHALAMAAPSVAWSKFVCWQCAGKADERCTLRLDLFADPKRGPDAMGHAVSRSGGALRVRVSVPRCRECRARARDDLIGFMIGAVSGGAIAAGGYWWLWQQGRLPDWFPIGGNEFTLWVLGWCGAFAGAIVAFAFRMRALRHKRMSGRKLRSYDDFPPIAALRAQGWEWPSSE